MTAVGELLGSIQFIYVTFNFKIIMSRKRFFGLATRSNQKNCYHMIDVPFEEHVAITYVLFSLKDFATSTW